MRIKVRFFAILRDAAGVEAVDLEIASGETVESLFEKIVAKYPSIQKYAAAISYAVNAEYAAPDTPLKNGDELALIPPISGG